MSSVNRYNPHKRKLFGIINSFFELLRAKHLRPPWTEEPGRLQSEGSQRVGRNWSDLAPAQVDSSGSLCQPGVMSLYLLFLNIYLFIWPNQVLIMTCDLFEIYCGMEDL